MRYQRTSCLKHFGPGHWSTRDEDAGPLFRLSNVKRGEVGLQVLFGVPSGSSWQILGSFVTQSYPKPPTILINEVDATCLECFADLSYRISSAA